LQSLPLSVSSSRESAAAANSFENALAGNTPAFSTKRARFAAPKACLKFAAKRREKFAIRPLSEETRAYFAERRRIVQSHFVDDPKDSVSQADHWVNQLMEIRGYPMVDFEQPAADISVDHPAVVENYRAAHDTALRHSRGQASTEDLRKALIHYRSLFEELLGDAYPQRKEARA
jgi:hypothetical protein